MGRLLILSSELRSAVGQRRPSLALNLAVAPCGDPWEGVGAGHIKTGVPGVYYMMEVSFGVQGLAFAQISQLMLGKLLSVLQRPQQSAIHTANQPRGTGETALAWQNLVRCQHAHSVLSVH